MHDENNKECPFNRTLGGKNWASDGDCICGCKGDLSCLDNCHHRKPFSSLLNENAQNELDEKFADIQRNQTSMNNGLIFQVKEPWEVEFEETTPLAFAGKEWAKNFARQQRLSARTEVLASLLEKFPKEYSLENSHQMTEEQFGQKAGFNACLSSVTDIIKGMMK